MNGISNRTSFGNFSYDSLKATDSKDIKLPQSTLKTSKTVNKTNDYSVDVIDTGSGNNPAVSTSKKLTAQAGLALTAAAPTAVTNMNDMVTLMKDGDFKFAIPMVGGTKITSALEVREDTRAAFTFKVQDGKVDFSQTRVFFEKSDGQETDLDGPLFWNPDSVYIDEKGHLIADIKCFPNIDITKEVLGVDKIPNNMEGIAALVSKMSGGETQLNLMAGQDFATQVMPELPTVKVNGTDIEVITVPAEEEPEEEPGEEWQYNSSTDPKKAQKLSIIDTVKMVRGTYEKTTLEVLIGALELNQVEVSFTGALKPGRVSFGSEMCLDVAENSKIELKGTPAHMTASLNVPLRSLQMMSGGTMISAKAGNIGLDIDLTRATDHDDALNFKTPLQTKVAVKTLAVDDFAVEAPSASGAKNKLSWGHLDLAAGGVPLINLAMNGRDSNIDLVMPRTDFNGIKGQIEVTGSDGQPAMFKLGETASGKEMKLSAGVEFHSADKSFKLEGDVKNIAASLDRLAVVDSECFDLTMSGAAISGSGHISFDSNAESSRLDLQADADQPFTVSAGIEDAFLGDMSKGGLLLDIGEGSSAGLALKQLTLDGNHPLFRASANIDVILDEVSLPLDGLGFSLAKGTRGTLSITDMGWKEGAVSPDFTGEIRIALGQNKTVAAGPVAGLDGAKVEIDSSNGEASLVLAATLDENGHVTCAGGLTFDKTLFKAEVNKGNLTVEEAKLSPVTTKAVQASGLVGIRTVGEPPKVEGLKALDTTDAMAALTRIEPNIEQIVGSLTNTNIKIDIPVAKLSGQLVKLSNKQETIGRFFDDTSGWEVTVSTERPAGSIVVNLAVEKGNIKTGGQAIIIEPPLKLNVKGQYWLPILPGGTSLSADITISKLEIRKDKDTGKAYFYPIVAPGVLSYLPDKIENKIKEKLYEFIGGFAGNALFGEKQFTTNLKELYHKLDEHLLSAPDDPEAEPSAIGQQLSEQLPALLNKVDIKNTKFTISKTELQSGTIDLGNGQKLTIGKGSNLTITGNTDKFQITGTATLGDTIIGDQNIGAQLNGASVNLEMYVEGALSDNPQVKLSVTNINADNISINGALEHTNLQLKNATVKNGSFTYSQLAGKSEPIINFNFPSIKAGVSLKGGATFGTIGGRAEALSGELDGSISMNNGVISGKVNKINVEAKDLNIVSGESVTKLDLSLDGAGKFNIDEAGNITFDKTAGRQLNIDTTVILSDGSRYTIGAGSVDKIKFGAAGELYFDGVKGKLDCVSKLPIGVDGQDAILDIRAADIAGGITIDGGFSTNGDIKVDNLDGSLKGLGVDTESFKLDLNQVDVLGSGIFNMSPAGTVIIRAVEDGALNVVSRADDIKFNLVEQDLKLDLKDGAAVRGDLSIIQVGGEAPMMINIQNGTFSGTIEEGETAINLGDDANIKAQIAKGSKVKTSFNIDYTEEHDPKFDAKVTLDGKFDVSTEKLAKLHNETADFSLETLDADGSFRMQVNAKADGKGQFAASSALELSSKIDFAGEGQVNVEALGQ